VANNKDNNNDQIIDIILQEIREIKNDVKELVQFKYKILGMVTLSSFIISVAVTLFLK
jgi:hypothetical protein